jgi:tRNA-dihydrouridine synthase B
MKAGMLRIGPLELKSNLILAPLAGYTNLPFRLVIRRLGGLGLATTDLVNARSLIEKKAKALKLIETRAEDSPLAVQLFGSVPGEMRDAALLLESMGVPVVDINMGCPVRKVCQIGGGSAMMTNQGKTIDLVKAMVAAVRIPVTVKMRLGWDEQNITAPDFAKALEDVGVAAITIHGRTRAQGFGGRVNLDGIRAVARAVARIPVIGNGDITTPEAARAMIEATGCAGVSVGRGAFYDPWIFRHTEHGLRTGVIPPEPPFAERVEVMRQHLDLMVEVFGDVQGCRMFRKIAPWYSRQFGPAREFNRRVVTLVSRAEFEDILVAYEQWRAQFLDINGELKPSYRPRPLVPSFMDPAEAGEEARAIAVPDGPVEWW